jgi:glycosyltransferase involved in cell wall biosynthesis
MLKKNHSVFAICPLDCELFSDNINEAFRSIGVNYIPVKLNRSGTNPLHDFMTLFRLIKILTYHKPDVVLNYTIKPLIYGSIAARIAGVKKIVSFVTGLGYVFSQGSLKAKILRPFVKVQVKLAIFFNYKVFFQNPDDKNEYIKHFLLTDKKKAVVTNGSGVNLEKFPFEIKSKKETVQFLFVGRLLRDKGVNEFIASAIDISVSFPEARFTIVGPFDSNPEAIGQMEMENITKNTIVKYVGPTDDVNSFIRNCDVFVLPSYHEGTPRTVLEAMSVGRAIITTDAPGCRETTINGYNGYLVSVKDVKALSLAMKRLLDNKAIIPVMGHNSRKLAEKKYDVTHVVNLILKEINI